MGASEDSATTVIPASRGPPMYKYLSFLLEHSSDEYYIKEPKEDPRRSRSDVRKRAYNATCVQCGSR